MRLIKEILYRCPYCMSYVYAHEDKYRCSYCMSYVYAHEDKYWCEECNRYWNKSTLEEVEDE